jgi:DNA-binding CsgD family transcriptional regulator
VAAPVTLRPVQDIVGRVAELDAIRSWLGAPSPPILLLEGEAGIGKTTLWRACVDEAREDGLRVLAASSVQSEAQLSFTTFRDLVDEVFDDVADELPEPQRRALAVTLLREEPEGAPPDRGAIGVAFLRVLRELGGRDRTLVAVDDVQWTDAASQAPLRYALRRIEPNRGVRILLARRVDDQSSVPLELDRLDAGRIKRHGIGPLSVGALGHILHVGLDTTYPRPTLRRIHEVSGGNPFFALELARAVRTSGAANVGAGLPVSSTLHELVDERLLSLPADTMDVLLVSSVLSRPTLDVLGAALGGNPRALVEPAMWAHVVDVDEDTVRFVHPLFAAAVYDLATAERRREVHRRLAQVVTDEEEHARHLALGAEAPSEPVAAVVEEGARLAAARGASSAAAELLEDAHRLTPEEDDVARSRRAIDAGWLHFIAGNPARARSLLEVAGASAPAGPLHARALVRRAWLDHHTGDRRAALSLYRAALEEAVGDPQLEAEIHSLLAWCVFIMREDVPLAERHAREAVALCAQLSDAVLEADSLAVLAQIEFFQGGGLPSPTMERALGLRPDAVDQRVLRHPRQHWALLLLDADRLDEARSHMQFARDLADAHGDESALPWPLMRLSHVELLAGNWEQAASYAEAGHEAAVETGQLPPQADLLCTRALVLAHVGRLDEARATAEDGLRLAESCGAGIGRRLAEWALGLADLSSGALVDARDRLQALRDSSRAAGIVDPGENRYLADLGETLVAVGELEEAGRLADELDQLGVSLQRPTTVALAGRIRGLAALERGDLDSALAILEWTVRHHDETPIPFDRARTLLALGTAQRRARQRRAARATLESALAVFDGLGAEVWAAKTRAELGRIGGRAPSSDALTPTEERVAVLVAEGKSNKEVASDLVLSVHTVEAALTSIYRKLGVRSRTELARKVAGSDGDQ